MLIMTLGKPREHPTTVRRLWFGQACHATPPRPRQVLHCVLSTFGRRLDSHFVSNLQRGKWHRACGTEDFTIRQGAPVGGRKVMTVFDVRYFWLYVQYGFWSTLSKISGTREGIVKRVFFSKGGKLSAGHRFGVHSVQIFGLVLDSICRKCFHKFSESLHASRHTSTRESNTS